MNQTNQTDADPWEDSVATANAAAIWTWWITLGCFTLQLGFLAALMRRDQFSRFAAPNSRRRHCQLLSPIDAQLIVILVTNLLSNISSLPSLATLAFQIVSTISSGFLQLLILCYTWYRAHLIVNQVMLERKYVLYYALIIYGLLQFAGIVFQTMYFCVIDINLASLALTVVADLEYAGEVLAFLVELAVVVNYIVFLRQARADSARQDTDRLALVARYGIASFCCFQLYLFATVGFCYVNAGVEPIVSVGFYTALYCLQQLFPIAYIQIQLGMKWSISIAREKVRDAPTVIIMSGAKTSLGKLSSMQS